MSDTESRVGWSYFGEQVDAMSESDQRFMWETCRDEGESFEDWLASLYRGPKRRSAA